MSNPPLPEDEAGRLEALERFRLRNITREARFNELTQVTADVLDVPIALVTIIDSTLQCYAGAMGFELAGTPREVSFCAHTILKEEPMIVPDATLDPRFEDNMLVTGAPFIRFYAGVPIHAAGMRVGTLCVIDTVPRKLSESALKRLKGLARVGERLIESRLDEFLKTESEARLERYVEAMPVALAVYDSENRFVLSNGLYRETFFHDREARIPAGLGFPELLARMAAEGPALRIEGYEGEWIQLRLKLREAHVGSYEMCLDGERWLHVREVQVEGGGVLATFTDITELKHREQALAAQSALLRTTLESIYEGIAVFDPSGRMIACSDAYYELLDLPTSLRPVGTPLFDIVGDVAQRGFLGEGEPEKIANRALADLQGRSSGRCEVRTLDGSTLAFTWMVAEDERIIITCQDVSERREVERLKDEFVSTVSHELRTPLTSIAGSLGLLAGGVAGELPPRAARLVDIAHKNVDRLARLVNDLLDIDKIESGQMQFRRELLDLNTIAVQAVEQNRPYAERFGVSLECRTDNAPVVVLGDPDRILQVAANLISNAVKYSPPSDTVCVISEALGGSARLSVKDHGPGIPEDFRARLFRRFAQADGSDRRAQQGTGLGLSIALAIVERHGGAIEVDSRPGEGATFHVDLPRAEREPTAERPNPGARLLLCEDDRSVAAVLRRALERRGASVEVVETKTEALERLAGGQYGALVLDVMLPDGNSLDLIRALRARTDTKDLPIVIVSAVADEVRNSEAVAGLGVLDWLSKPVDLSRLVAALAPYRSGQARRLHVLHVEDEQDTGHVVRLALADFADVVVASDLQDARARLAAGRFDVAILDLALPDGSGAELIPELTNTKEGPVPVIIFSASDAPQEVAEAVSKALTKSRSSIEQLAAAVKEVASPTESEA